MFLYQFLTFLMLWPFHSVPHVVGTPNRVSTHRLRATALNEFLLLNKTRVKRVEGGGCLSKSQSKLLITLQVSGTIPSAGV